MLCVVGLVWLRRESFRGCWNLRGYILVFKVVIISFLLRINWFIIIVVYVDIV